MTKVFKPYHLEIQGIDKNLFLSDPFYRQKAERIDFDGLIREFKIEAQDQVDYVSLAPKFKPHSDHELMIQSTDKIVKSASTALATETIHKILDVGYRFVDFLSNPDIVRNFGLDDGYMYLVYNYDEFTTDRTSGMSKKPFHLHMNSWKKDTLKRITPVEQDKVSPYYYQSIIDPIFDITQILANDALACEELKPYLTESKVHNDKIGYASVFEVKGGWKTLQDRDFAHILQIIHKRLENRYVELLECFTGMTTVPDEYTRHQVLPDEQVIFNIQESNIPDSTKAAILNKVGKIRSVTNEQFDQWRQNGERDLIDTLVSLRWLAYSVGFFSDNYLNCEFAVKDQPMYINVTPRLFTKIGGASIMNFPEHPLVKLDKGNGEVTREQFAEKSQFHKEFAKTLE